MALVAQIENGTVIQSSSQSSLAATSNSNSSMDKDSFLQLLVAQMKYQDPLEPTSNTEYISQYAQFSQVEQMQNMSASMDLQRASQLVGKEVYMKVTTASGDTNLIQGKVDYVVYENGKAYLAINESLYDLADLDTVVDGEYMDAFNLVSDFLVKLNKLPSVNNIDLGDADTIDELNEIYQNMTTYQKSFVATEKLNSLNAYVTKLDELRTAADKETDTEIEDVEGSGDANEDTGL